MRLKECIFLTSLAGAFALSACTDKQNSINEATETILRQQSEAETEPQDSVSETIKEEQKESQKGAEKEPKRSQKKGAERNMQF